MGNLPLFGASGDDGSRAWDPRQGRVLDSGNLWLGTSGWSYDDWNGVFYPPHTAQRERLVAYARRFSTVEIDSTFYAIPSRRTVQGWRERVPERFVFSAKFPRAVSHEARLVDCEDEAIAFVEAMQELGPKMGALLLQLPPDFTVDNFDALARFLDGLPDGHCYAVEVRHPSWLVEEYAELLKRWNVAMVLTDGEFVGRFWRVTSRVCYVRWLGERRAIDRFDREVLDRSADLDWWAPRMRHFLERGGTVIGYVNNHFAGHSPTTVEQLQSRTDLLATGPRQP